MTFAVLVIAVTSFTLLQSLIVPVLARLQVEFNTSQSTATWVLTAYLLSAAIFTPILGRIGDVVGKQRMLVITLGMLTLGSLAAALAPSVGWLIAARILQGAGGGVVPLSFGIIRDEFEEGMTKAVSVLASITSVGFAVGIVAAGPIVDGLGYHWLFWLPMIATAVAGTAAYIFIPKSPVGVRVRLPITPALMLSVWLTALLIALSMGNSWGWTSPWVFGLLTIAAVVAVVWIRTENRAAVPMIDMKMMRMRGVWTANLVGLFVGFVTFASMGFLPQLVQTPKEVGYGFSASISESGYLLLPSTIASIFVGFVTAPLIMRFGARYVITGGLLAMGASFASIALWHEHMWQLWAATIFYGLSGGLVFASLAGVVVSSVPREQTGVASGMNANIRNIGGSIGSAVMAGILTARLGNGGFPIEDGYVIGFLVLAALMVLAAVAASWIPDQISPPKSGALEDPESAELGLLPDAGAAVDRT